MRPEYERFFKRCVEDGGLSEADHKMNSAYCQIKPVVPGWNVHFEWNFAGRAFSCLEVGLHYERKPEFNRRWLASVRLCEDAIHEASVKDVIVEEIWGNNVQWSRMCVQQKTTREEIVHLDLRPWAVETMRIFREHVEPTLEDFCRREHL
jgi:hypothetical protein